VSRIVYFDCASGASGDMLLGAIVDLGLPLDSLRAELAKLPLRGYRLEAHRVHRSGLHATKVDVVLGDGEGGGGDSHHAGHEGHSHPHPHRGLRDVLGLVDASTLAPAVKERSTALFRRLAEAEAAVHGSSPDEVHFHEVGAVDSIVDIVGGVVGLEWLGAGRFVASPLNVGTGSVTMSHGTFSVPPPATARLVHGAPIYGSGAGELLTPTGALLVTSYATSYGPLPPLKLEATGHGAGTRDVPGHPNVLRLLVGEETTAPEVERVVVLECEIDDMSPQLFPPLVEALLRAGAKDAYVTPIQMKKGRPGMLVSVVAAAEQREAVEETLFRETTTLGVRHAEWSRTVLERETVTVDTAYGPVAVKIGRRGERIYNVQPEFDDCQQRAGAAGAPVKEVQAAALAAWRSARPKGS
jgi:pyridinium-3,5-bisthiocarboxylic acid mononucleotide nickel chelatase